MMKYCNQCVMPSTRPDLSLDEEGVCDACRSYKQRAEIDWKARGKELPKILEKYRSRSGGNWDCIVPVSGGKDSTYKVICILEFGFNPLCVTSITCDLSDFGRKSIQNRHERIFSLCR